MVSLTPPCFPRENYKDFLFRGALLKKYDVFFHIVRLFPWKLTPSTSKSCFLQKSYWFLEGILSMSPPKKACIIHDVGNKPYIYVLCLFLLGPVLPTKKTTKVSILSLKFFLQVFLQVQGLNLWKKRGWPWNWWLFSWWIPWFWIRQNKEPGLQ